MVQSKSVAPRTMPARQHWQWVQKRFRFQVETLQKRLPLNLILLFFQLNKSPSTCARKNTCCSSGEEDLEALLAKDGFQDDGQVRWLLSQVKIALSHLKDDKVWLRHIFLELLGFDVAW